MDRMRRKRMKWFAMEPPRMPYPRSFPARLHVYSSIIVFRIDKSWNYISQVLCAFAVVQLIRLDDLCVQWILSVSLIWWFKVFDIFSCHVAFDDLVFSCHVSFKTWRLPNIFSGIISRPGASYKSAIHFPSGKEYIPPIENERSPHWAVKPRPPTVRFLVSW